ncbi:hypothetical protein OROMI_007166 [Orobanche minor]
MNGSISEARMDREGQRHVHPHAASGVSITSSTNSLEASFTRRARSFITSESV